MPDHEPARGDAEAGGESIPYAAASAELDRILVDLESDNLDVDVLAERVRRAAALIAACRERIASATIDVQRVVADLDPDQPPPTG